MIKPKAYEIERTKVDSPNKPDRQSKAETLAEIITEITEPFVIAIDAPWGHGKSTFLKYLTHEFGSKGLKSINFNAWESDYIEDPLIALIGSLEEQLENIIEQSDSRLSLQLESLKKAGASILSSVAPAAIRAITLGALNTDDILEAFTSESLEKLAQERLEKYQKSQQSITKFKTKISEIINKIYPVESQLPLVFVIDELDRCRPNHAIRLLEIIKHLFDINRAVFVIATDIKQLGNAAKTIYGHKMDTYGYFRRFFDIEIQLQHPAIKTLVKENIDRYNFEVFFSNRISNGHSNEVDEIKNIAFIFSNSTLMTPRDLERFFTVLSLAMKRTGDKNQFRPCISLALAATKIKNDKLYQKLILKRCTPEEIVEYLTNCDSTNKNELDHIKAFTKSEFTIAFSSNDEIWEKYRLIADKERPSLEERIYIEYCSETKIKSIKKDFDYLIQRINVL